MRSRVVSHHLSRGFTRADAEDFFGEALLKAVERADSLRSLEAAEPWFWQLAIRHATDVARRRSRVTMRRGVEFDSLEAPPEPEVEETCRCSLEILAELPDQTREILVAVDLQDEKVKDYAARAEITANNAAVRLYRARQTLRDRLYETCQTTSVSECLECCC